ncbi:MAG: DUF4270 domain-containing protein [Prevotella sp.]|nr:DUF4270 domain-containing protein [Prevotella sp.]
MKFKFITAIALCAMAFISCDEDTANIGTSLTSENDRLTVTTRSFDVLTKSVAVDSVFTRERQGYFGRVKDPETNAFVKSEFTTQFNMMESAISEMPKREAMGKDENGNIVADSCYLQIIFDVNSSYGDTLASMKLRISELDKPINNELMHYTNFDPKGRGYIRQGGLQYDKMFSLRDLTVSDSIRNLREINLHRNTSTTSDNSYYDMLNISLNKPYTDKNGVTYNNYGTYILRTFYEHPEFFKNSYNFVNHVFPGIHLETIDGTGVMARIMDMNLFIFFKNKSEEEEFEDFFLMTSTEEVVQTTKVTNDKEAINRLVADNSCTYLKTPAGIFTEVTLPVDEISTAHPTDSLLSAQVAFQRQNNLTQASALSFSVPDKLILIEKDSLDSFFKSSKLSNNLFAYQVSLDKNAYTFNNISNLITRMHLAKENGLKSDPNWTAKHPNWNKALLVPVEVNSIKSYTTTLYYGTQTSETPISTGNELGLTSTRLVKGTAEQPIQIKVIYGKFKD